MSLSANASVGGGIDENKSEIGGIFNEAYTHSICSINSHVGTILPSESANNTCVNKTDGTQTSSHECLLSNPTNEVCGHTKVHSRCFLCFLCVYSFIYFSLLCIFLLNREKSDEEIFKMIEDMFYLKSSKRK
jgi:hypothetical protein